MKSLGLRDKLFAPWHAQRNIEGMPRRASSHEPEGPTLTSGEARLQLEEILKKGRDLLPLQPLPEERYDAWSNRVFEILQAAFGQHSGHLLDFAGQTRISLGPVPEHYAEPQRRKDLERRVRVLEAIIECLPAATTESSKTEDFWARLHTSVVQASRTRFDAGHYADAVEAALKELNQKVKDHVRKKTGQEFDGADLMNRAFSPKSPIITLADLSTEDGRNIQQGYMQIFAGAMTGIRNPKAHSNVSIDEKRAIHHLHLASLLHQIFDERL